MNKNGVTVIRNAKGKVVGEVSRYGVFSRRLKSSKHMYRSPMGWAVDQATLHQAVMAGAVVAEIVDIESGDVWQAPTSSYYTYGIQIDHGHGKQVLLTHDHWEVRSKNVHEDLGW